MGGSIHSIGVIKYKTAKNSPTFLESDAVCTQVNRCTYAQLPPRKIVLYIPKAMINIKVYSALKALKKVSGALAAKLTSPSTLSMDNGITIMTAATSTMNCSISVETTAHNPPAETYKTQKTPRRMIHKFRSSPVETSTIFATG